MSLVKNFSLFDLKHTYVIESDIYKIGDITIEFSKMYNNSEKNKINYIFCVNNTYAHNFEDSFDFVKEVTENLFEGIDEQSIINACGVNEELLLKYKLIDPKTKKGEDHLNNIISDKFPQIKLIQYLNYIYK